MNKFVFKKYIPSGPGIYAFFGKEGLLYIGKAKNLKQRIKNHFNQPSYRDDLFMHKVKKTGFIETGSEIEALILESNAIKNYRPKFNVLWKDDKNYFFVEITKEDCPRVFLTHQKTGPGFIGPFVDGDSIKRTLKTLRRVFPYYTAKTHPKNKCSWCHLGLCPGTDPDKQKYRKSIKNLKLVLEGKKSSALRSIKKEMEIASKRQDFERAAELRDRLGSLERVLENAKVIKETENYGKLKENLKLLFKRNISRIEGYDISNIQGTKATGSMVVFIDGFPKKEYYRKFKIRLPEKPNDTAMIKEVLERRADHKEWPFPDLILIDGGKGQLSSGLGLKKEIKAKFCALAKKHNELFVEGEEKPILLKDAPKDLANLILRIRDEAHRFAIAYHKRLRRSNLLNEH